MDFSYGLCCYFIIHADFCDLKFPDKTLGKSYCDSGDPNSCNKVDL